MRRLSKLLLRVLVRSTGLFSLPAATAEGGCMKFNVNRCPIVLRCASLSALQEGG